MTGGGVFSVDRDVVTVSGTDAAEYLQGQLSQDITAVGVGQSAWSLVLQPGGKVDSWFRVHRRDENQFVFDLDAGHAGAAVARLERFRLRTDVEFSVESSWRLVGIRGAVDLHRELGAELSVEVDWPGFEGVDHLGPGLTVPGSVAEWSTEEYEAARIRAGWPRLGHELTEDTIPGEAGSGLIEASVSFSKGCYTGQELVARIDSRGGNVPWPIRRLDTDADDAPPIGAEVLAGDDMVGHVTSSAPRTSMGPAVALARVRRKVEPGEPVAVGGVEAIVRALDGS